MTSRNETWQQSYESMAQFKSPHRTPTEGLAPSSSLFLDLAIFWDFFRVEFEKDDFRAVLRNDFSIRA